MIAEAVAKPVDRQIQFWSMLGPICVLSTIAVLLYKLTDHWHFPLCALIGIPLCIKWKMQGMIATLGALLIFTAIKYPDIEMSERYWHVGLSLAMAFSFIVLTLSLEEAQSVVKTLQNESKSRLDNCLMLDEKLKNADRAWEMEKEALQCSVESLSQALSKTTEEKQTFYKIAHLTKDELLQVREQHEQLLQAHTYRATQIAHLQEKLDTAELAVQNFVDTDAQKEICKLQKDLTALKAAFPSDDTHHLYRQLKKQFEEKTEVLAKTRQELFSLSEERLKHQREIEESALDFPKEVRAWQENCLQLCQKLESEQKKHQQEVDNLFSLIEELLRQIK